MNLEDLNPPAGDPGKGAEKIPGADVNQAVDPHLLASIFDSTPDGIISKTTDGIIRAWNRGAERILGYSAAEVIGKHISTIIPPNLTDEEFTIREQVAAGLSVEQHETYRLAKDGRRVPVSITLSPVRDAAGNITSIAKILRDITKLKLAEQQLHDSNESNRIFVEQAPNAIAMLDKDMRYLAASQKWIADYKIPFTDLTGRSHYDVFPEIGDEWKAIHQACLKGATDHCDEARFERADGTIQWISWDVRPWYLPDKQIGGLLLYTADITEAKEKDRAARRTQQILEKSNHVARIATWEFDPRTGAVNWSSMACEMMELPPGTLPITPGIFAYCKPGKGYDDLQAAMKGAREHGTPYDIEVEVVTGKGNTRWLRIIGESEFRNKICVRRFGIFQDITRSKLAEQQISKLYEEQRAILDSGYVSIISTDVHGTITHFSKGAELLLGYTHDEVVGKTSPMLFHLEAEVVQRGAALSALYGHPIEGFDVFVTHARKGTPETHEWTYVRKDGSHFTVQLVVSAIRDAKGDISGFLGIASDITDVKHAELQTRSLLQISTEQNERLKNFAHIVSHNLRSHAVNIQMLLDLYMTELGEPANEYLSWLKLASGNLNTTIDDLNQVAIINTSTDNKLMPVNLHQRIEAARVSIGQLAKDEQVTIVNDVDPDVTIMGLPAYVDSIVLNFITNSIKYRSRNRDSYVRLSAHRSGEYIIFQVQDNGLGIDLKLHRGKLFGMYKTFHANDDARGIGLFITRNQVEALGGKIDVESEPGTGTTFKVFLRHAHN